MLAVLDEKILSEMASAGVVYGHKKSKTHPKMRPYIAGQKNEIELIDPQATLEALDGAIAFLKEKLKNGGIVLLVGTKPPAKAAIKNFGEEFKLPYVINRWLGGTLTNFKVINERRLYYENLKSQAEKGALAKYTKKEQLQFSRQIQKLAQNFDGLSTLTRLPDALFVVDAKEAHTAIREANRLKIPIVAVVDTDDDVSKIQYPIFANDHAKASIEWVIGKIKEGLRQ
jgi:small subunit ribosomal protein S2